MVKSAEDIKNCLQNSPYHIKALREVRTLGLPDCYIAAGFVRNYIWDVANNFRNPTPLNDLDVIYYDAHDLSKSTETALEHKLQQAAPEYPWSVKNQARMHERNNDAPYKDISDALCHWCETVTPIGARLLNDDTIELIHPLGLEDLLTGQCHATPHALHTPAKHADYIKRMKEKAWDKLWPSVTVHDLEVLP